MILREIAEKMAAVLEARMGEPCIHPVNEMDECHLCKGRELLKVWADWKNTRPTWMKRKASAQ